MRKLVIGTITGLAALVAATAVNEAPKVVKGKVDPVLLQLLLKSKGQNRIDTNLPSEQIETRLRNNYRGVCLGIGYSDIPEVASNMASTNLYSNECASGKPVARTYLIRTKTGMYFSVQSTDPNCVNPEAYLR